MKFAFWTAVGGTVVTLVAAGVFYIDRGYVPLSFGEIIHFIF